MPPKKSQKAKTSKTTKEDKPQQNIDENPKDDPSNRNPEAIQNNNEHNHPSTREKRKSAPAPSSPPSKALKISPSFTSQQEKIIQFLLSDKALKLCQNPNSFSPSFSSQTQDQKPNFSSNQTLTLTPFQHLLSATILSRPISHVLGQRTIFTILNPPFAWENARDVINAGREVEDTIGTRDESNGEGREGGEVGKTERLQAMETARTQHRQKTASELGVMAQHIVDQGWDPKKDGTLCGLLQGVQDSHTQTAEAENESETSNQVQEEEDSAREKENVMRERLRKEVKEIKGMGDIGADIFLRRVQGCVGWEGVGWFVDGKTGEVLEELGMPVEGKELIGLIEGMEERICREEKGGERDVRGMFVKILERALGVGLEGKIEDVRREVGRM
ncbi:hypothetical protein EG329_005527 [Mollisiaceae sp. DMI_Dod_QoI]|nr:hypothetical protein EG329_005527 [Helotiales sp. DMI_Dod_QoI]